MLPAPEDLSQTLAICGRARWHLLFEHRGYRVFVDRSSIEQGPTTRALVRHEYPLPYPAQAGWPAYRSSIELRRFDFAAGTSGVEQSFVWGEPGAAGDPLMAAAFEPALERPDPRTMGDAVIEALARLLRHERAH